MSFVVATSVVTLITSAIFVALMSLRVCDSIRSGRGLPVRLGAWFIMAGTLIRAIWWFFRHILEKHGFEHASDFFYANSHVTILSAILLTIGTQIALTGILWTQYRWRGAAWVLLGAFATWVVAFTI